MTVTMSRLYTCMYREQWIKTLKKIVGFRSCCLKLLFSIRQIWQLATDNKFILLSWKFMGNQIVELYGINEIRNTNYLILRISVTSKDSMKEICHHVGLKTIASWRLTTTCRNSCRRSCFKCCCCCCCVMILLLVFLPSMACLLYTSDAADE